MLQHRQKHLRQGGHDVQSCLIGRDFFKRERDETVGCRRGGTVVGGVVVDDDHFLVVVLVVLFLGRRINDDHCVVGHGGTGFDG